MRAAVVGVLAVVALAACGSSSKDATDSSTTTALVSTSTTSTTAGGTNNGGATTPPATSGGGGGGGGTAPTTTAAPTGPVITSISGPPTVNVCSNAPAVTSPTQVTLKWTTTGATSVNVAIDSEGGVFASNLPPNGETTVPLPCGGDNNTYFVIALGPGGTRAVKSLTTEGRS
jgi:hypothetical protein